MASGSQSGWLEKQSTRDAWWNWFSGLFGLDLRSLAVYRIGMGLLLLSDLILRSRDLFAHYTDWGILPRDVNVYRPSHLMLHQLSGEAWYEALLFIVAGIFALLLIFGCWTRMATCVSWLLLASLQARNPLTNDGAQDLMRVLMFWNMFLPLGARYSVDAALNISLSQRKKRVVSVATFALMVQMCIMYWISYKFKTSPEWRSDGSAVYYALSLDMLTTSLGSWLRDFPVFLRGLTYFVVGLEAMTPLVFFFPWRNAIFRLVLIALVCGMHAGFIFCMWIEIFPFLCIVAWMAFVPSLAWDWLAERLRSPRRSGLALYYDGRSGWSRRWALWARTFCILPQMRIRRLAVNKAAAALAKQQGSLVLTDSQGRSYCGRVALREMLCRSPVAWPLGWIVSWFVSDRAVPRPAPSGRSPQRWLEDLTVLFPFRRMRLRSWWITQAFVTVWLVYIVGYNLNQIGINSIDLGKIPEMVRDPSMFPDAMLVSSSGNGRLQLNFNDWMNYRPTWKYSTPHTILWSFRMLGLELRLDQRWAMFAPNPLKDDGWFVFAARLEDNTTIDLWTEKPVTFARPRWVAGKFPNYRWFKFMENFLGPTNNTGFHPHIGRYFHRQWNERHPGNKIIQLDIYFIAEISQPPYVHQALQERHIMRWCRNNECK
ncbi:MAG: HTTM domain-containing protein [Planctomycetes bacterium]|nr:HTTM domain-containing protein [Planctomycetota bacterium]